MMSASIPLRAPQSAGERQAMVNALEDGRSWPTAAGELLAELGFRLVDAERMADHGSHLLVALRATPTLRHFDPECVAYYAPCGAVAKLATIDRSIVAARGDQAARRVLWGQVQVIDRIPVHNRFLTFGGELRAAVVDSEVTVLDLRSPAPIVRWGGHSQATDPVTDAIGAFFGRLMVPVNYVAGVAAKVDSVSPDVVYRAFLLDALTRASGWVRVADEPSALDSWLRAAWARARADRPSCAAAERLLAELHLP